MLIEVLKFFGGEIRCNSKVEIFDGVVGNLKSQVIVLRHSLQTSDPLRAVLKVYRPQSDKKTT